MTLAAGTRLGPYEILSPLGAGGMGEVYRARDTRLAREVAIKVLPAAVSADPERLRRFEKEARSASTLNHPSIVTIHDVGSEGGVSYLAMELVDGVTLRQLLTGGPVPVRKLIAIAQQIADGLAKAHAAGIVHRDLKPENVMVNKDGLVKILDFGLAKLSSSGSGSGEGSQLPTMTVTEPGVVVGTVGYMSPEQARGERVDFRSDQFSFGSILYEMATGRRAFQGKTAIDTLSAILNDEPAPIAQVASGVPPPLRWIIQRCLAKGPEGRFASTDDLARDLSGLREHISEVSSGDAGVAPVRRSPPWPRILGWIGLIGVALLAAAYFFPVLRSRATSVPRFQQVTFQQGSIWSARFAPDGQTVVYGMSNVGNDLKTVELYSTRVGSLDSRSLGLRSADIFAISKSGQMAISVAPGDGPLTPAIGTLAQVSLSGGTPRLLLENTGSADWSPDGKDLAVVHKTGEKYRIEYPIGNVLYESPDGGLLDPQVSPDGAMVAFSEWRPATPGALRVVDRKRVVRTLLKDMGGVSGACWDSVGEQLWWIRVDHHDSFGEVQASEVHAVTLKGQDRLVASFPGDFGLHDLASDGRLLVEHIYQTYAVSGFFAGETGERSLAWLDQSRPAALSADGQTLLFADRGDTAGTSTASYLRKTDGSPAVRLGEGYPQGWSPDGKWVVASRGTRNSRLVLLPTGAGQERPLSTDPVYDLGWAAFHPDGKRIFFSGMESGHRPRGYEMSLGGGSPKAVTPEGEVPMLLSPDGALLLVRTEGTQSVAILPSSDTGRTAARPVATLSAHDEPVHWSSDGRSLLISNDSTRPIRIDSIDLISGRRSLWKSFSPGGLLGSGGLTGLAFSADEKTWVAGYNRWFSELLIVDGLK